VDPYSKKVKTALYIKNHLDYRNIYPTPVPVGLENVYSTGVEIKLKDNDYINILSIYMPEGPKNDNSDWLKSADFLIKKWIILGDFNAHAPFWDSGCKTVSCNRFVENILDSRLYLLNDGRITRVPDVANHKPSAIDLSLLSPSLAVNCTWNVEDECLGSDHLLITLSFNENISPNLPTEKDKVPKFLYKLADWSLFQSSFDSYDYDNVQNDDIDIFYANLSKIILSAAENSIPQCKPKRKGKHTGNAWWSSECKQAVKDKKKQLRTWLKNKTDDNFIEMKRAKIRCNKIIALAKKNFWTEFCKSEIAESKDMHKVWSKLKEMKNVNNLPNYPITLTNNHFPSALEKAEAFATTFAENSNSSILNPEMKAFRLQEEMQEKFKDINNNYPDQSFLNSPFTFNEFIEILHSFTNNTSSVGIDGISYQMLSHLPPKWKRLLFSFYQQCWLNGALPKIWKQSIVIPILKEGKPKTSLNSYRPISLTSHSGKVLEKIIQRRLEYFCEKNDIIPLNQAGFRKGRSTADHLVKLTHHIKKQFSRRKSTLATFFDVKKAYDRVWHAKLLHKIKKVGIQGLMYDYLRNFLSDRTICARVGCVYSTIKKVDIGIPQGAVIAPLLFSLLVHDLPKIFSKQTNIVQYADDIAIWINASLRKNTPKRVINHVQKIYQEELTKFSIYMQENGLELSCDKTNLVLFNNGDNPNHLPILNMNGHILQYKDDVKFLGIYLTKKLNWKMHMNHLIGKIRKRLNFLKLVSAQPWSQDVNTLLNLAISLVRSKITYGQEVYFSAPNCFLQKLESLDSKAIKIAMGVPVHASTSKTYKECDILPLHEYRKVAVSKYVARSLSVPNSVFAELFIDRNSDYPKRARNIQSLQPIFNYTYSCFEKCDINISDIYVSPVVPMLPPWEMAAANFDIDYSAYHKSDNVHILTSEVRNHLEVNYNHHLKVFTDGSLLESSETGAGFVIPDLKVQKSFYLGKGFSIFTAELFALMMALDYIETNIHPSVFNIVICVDSKSVLQAIKSWSCRVGKNLIFEIKFLIHKLISRGTCINFCWVPSHCGILWNEVVDGLAKQGALQVNINPLNHSLVLSSREIGFKLQNASKAEFCNSKSTKLFCPRYIASLIYKLRLNAWNTKFSKNILCTCLQPLSIPHVLYECPVLTQIYDENHIDFSSRNVRKILNDTNIIIPMAYILKKSNVGRLL
jgi:ribonuclease HI